MTILVVVVVVMARPPAAFEGRGDRMSSFPFLSVAALCIIVL